jgi:hypothetical protein
MQPTSVRSLADPCGPGGASVPTGRPGTLAVMGVSLHHIVIDAHDLPALARFWAQVLDWRILSEREREVVIGPDETAPVGICVMPVTDEKIVKNRLHVDLSPDSADRDVEIERILALGARRVDIGQTGRESWTVLADPEGTSSVCCVRRGPSSSRRAGSDRDDAADRGNPDRLGSDCYGESIAEPTPRPTGS